MPAGRSTPRAYARSLAVAAVGGALAAGGAGVADAASSWELASQFVRGAAKLRFVAYTLVGHALIGALVALLVAGGTLVLLRWTALGPALRGLADAHAARRARDPGAVLGATAVILALGPALALTLVGVYLKVMPFVSGRHSMSLVVAVVMVGTLVAVGAAIPLALLAGRALELPLRALARNPRIGRALSWIYAPLALLVVVAVLGIAAYLARGWNTLEIRAFRGPLIVALLAGVLVFAALPLARRLVAIVATRGAWARRGALAGGVVVLVGGVLGLGADPQVIEAATAHTKFGGTLTRLVRKGFDWDRDGYARVLSGGDCDDGDPRVHPGARDVPGDGIDQNCLGGDAPGPAPHDVGFAPVPPGVPADANILFITVDTVRADHLGAYGYHRPTSPRLDQLAAEGVVFENGWSHASSTYFAVPSIVTGRLPFDVRTGPRLERAATIAPEAHTMAEALSAAGLVTGAITNLPYFDPARGITQGFASYDNENAKLHGRAGLGDARGTSAPEQTAKALQFVDRHAQGRWFLWVHYFDPHYRYERHPTGPQFGDREIDLYDGELRFTDTAIGALLDGLRARGLDQRTIVVVTSDHGEGFGEHGVDFHAHHLYAQQTKVPFLIKVPGLAPRRTRTPIGHIDLLPTLVNLAGGAPHADMMGRSMVDVLAAAEPERVVFQQLLVGRGGTLGAVSRDCHVLYHVGPNTTWEVYRTDRDPAELEDLSADPAACASTRAALVAWCERGCTPAK